MKRNVLYALSIIALAVAIAVASIGVFAADGSDATDEIPYIAHDSSLASSSNYDSTYTAYDSASAAEAGVPEGYSGYVIKIEPKSNSAYAGLCLDFSAQKIPVDNIESIAFRVYMYSTADYLRIRKDDATSNWVLNSQPTATGWTEFTLNADGSGFASGDMSTLKDSDDNLGSFCLIGRFYGSTKFFFLDAVTITYKDGASDDATPPVITYDGATSVDVKEGDIFALTDAYAYDEYDNASCALSYSWSDGALDSAGRLKAGTHTCTVSATDRTGNTAHLVITVNVKADTSKLIYDDIPFHNETMVETDASYNGTASEIDSSAAASLGLPEGYSGNVIKVEKNGSSAYIAVGINFSSEKIPVSIIESITFRVYVPTNYEELRMKSYNTTDWIVRSSSAPADGWYDLTLTSSGTNFYGSNGMAQITDSDGYLGEFWLIGRNKGTYAPYYIDSITIKLKEDDSTAPVISYEGDTDIVTSAGKPFMLDISAYDEFEERFVDLSYSWSAGATAADGKLTEGVHTCTVSATDFFKNTSTLVFNVTVNELDTQKPEILFYADEIYASVGTYYRMTFCATDNYDAVSVVASLTDGALDEYGRLLAGDHTLTLTCADLTGNMTQLSITLHVIDGNSDVGTLITPNS